MPTPAKGTPHPYLVCQGGQSRVAIWDVAETLFRRGVQLGGTLTGDHGVGVLKRRLNPGKVFEKLSSPVQ